MENGMTDLFCVESNLASSRNSGNLIHFLRTMFIRHSNYTLPRRVFRSVLCRTKTQKGSSENNMRYFYLHHSIRTDKFFILQFTKHVLGNYLIALFVWMYIMGFECAYSGLQAGNTIVEQ